MTSRPPWALLAALVVVVSLAVYGLARWQPFEVGTPAAASVAGGDPVRGGTVFAGTCAGCHGEGGQGGGVGPALAGTGLGAADVAAVVAAGRGVMPAGLAEGADLADVAAYVAGISGGDAGTGTTGAPPDDTPVAVTGRAVLTGPGLSGLDVELDAAAPADWTVWVEGGGGRLRVAAIPAGGRASRTRSADGGRPLSERVARVLVGADPAAPALAGTLAPERARELELLLVDDPGRAGDASLVDAAGAQVAILREHVRFLALARDEGNLANVRFHGEHMVNITRGEPLQDVDGNGDISDPGDGVGLVDGPDAHLPRIAALAGPGLEDGEAAAALATLIGRQGALAGTAGSVAEAGPAIAAIERADALLAAAWTRMRASAGRSAVIELGAP